METVHWKVEGMTCANCALTINKYLEKQGQRNVRVNPIDGDVSFELADPGQRDRLRSGIEGLGYSVLPEEGAKGGGRSPRISGHLLNLLLCLPFTLVLMLHMFTDSRHLHWLMDPRVQLLLCLPVYAIGMRHFGRSAFKSLRNGVPNMNVLITLGATAAFAYSLAGSLMGLGPDYLFYETAAAIITLVFLGNLLEDLSMKSTQRALTALAGSQKVMANMIAFDGDHQEVVLPMDSSQLQVGDLVLIRSGEQVPSDCKVLWGEAHVSEAVVTGEPTPLHKRPKDLLIGGSILESGSLRAQVTAAGEDTVLAGILRMVRKAQAEKPPVQLLADRISAVFVPVVAGIALLTLLGNWLVLGDFTAALMRAIAVLVIACPCAMGLATPAAIAVGLGRAARSGILFRDTAGLERFNDIRQVVFDKTGTLTNGSFSVTGIKAIGIPEEALKHALWSMEKYSNHPIARCITAAFRSRNEIRWKEIREEKGWGMKGVDRDGNTWAATGYAAVAQQTDEDGHNVYVLRNDTLVGWVDTADELRPEAASVVAWFKRRGIRTVLLSGDTEERCRGMAERLGMDAYHSGHSPAQKLEKIAALTAVTPTVMVGDGINDAPALAKATVGISLSEASHLAMQHAQVVLMNHGLRRLPTAIGLGRHTYLTIRQNLFWAFFYNIVAIPVAAFGFLTPTFGALVMGLSDVVLAANSAYLFAKKVD